jgi:hypothetical protein
MIHMTTRKLRYGVVLLGSLMIGAAGTAAANGDSGFYMDAEAGIALYPKGLAIGGATAVLKRGPMKQNDFAWAFAAGYRINSYVAIELGFVDLGAVSGPLVDPTGATKNRGEVGVSARGKTLSVLAHLPSGNWDPYLKFGVMQAIINRSIEGQSLLFKDFEISGFSRFSRNESPKAVLGVGFRYAFSDQWALSAAVDYYPRLTKDAYDNGGGNVTSARAGFAYRF